MHPYATDSQERKVIPFFIAGTGILLGWVLNRILNLIEIPSPWWIDAPSVMLLYGLIYDLFDKYIWKWGIWRRLKIIRVPDLNGKWVGYLCSSYSGNDKKLDGELEIFQTWRKIQIKLKTKYSKSVSLVAAIVTKDPDGVVIDYEYINEPEPNAMATMHAHRGTAFITQTSDGNTLEGNYYAGRDRRTIGTLRFGRN